MGDDAANCKADRGEAILISGDSLFKWPISRYTLYCSPPVSGRLADARRHSGRKPSTMNRLLSLPALILWANLAPAAAPLPLDLAVEPARFTLAGVQETRQLLVSLRGPDGRLRDESRSATYSVSPKGVVNVSPNGQVRVIGKGTATVRVEVGDKSVSSRVEVVEADADRPIHFGNDIVPLLTRYGCNAGGCHGKASGQNGFKLSLFGFDSAFDYSAIVHEARGRRLFPAAPERSLLLTKGSGQVAHGGGKRLPIDGEAYATILRWIAQGA